MFSFLIVDDHPIIRSGLKHLIDNSQFVAHVDFAIDAESALDYINKHQYHLIILDINMPRSNTINLVSIIKAQSPISKILIFTINNEAVFAKKYFKLGVNGYIHKAAPNDELVHAINTILDNGQYLSPEFKQHLCCEALTGSEASPFSRLSSREFEVALLLLQGKGVSAISRHLDLHISSIATYKYKIFEKCKVDNLLDLYSLAKENMII